MSNTVLRLFNKTTSYKKIDQISQHKEIYAMSLEVSNYIGPLIQIKKDDDTNSLDIYAKQDGLIDIDAIIAHVGVIDTYRVSIFYGQKGFSNATALPSNRGIIAIAGLIEMANGYPAVYFNGTSTRYSAALPYAPTSTDVSITAAFKTTDVSGGQVIAGEQQIGRGFVMYLYSGTPLALSYKPLQSLVSGSPMVAGGTYCLTIVQTETNVALHQDGALISNATEAYSDYNASISTLQIGAWGNQNYWQGHLQFLGFSELNEGSNAAEIYEQLNSRYNLDSTNSISPLFSNETTGIYFSDSPDVLPSGEYANGRLSGKIRFSEFINFFVWTNLPKSKIGSIDIVNIDSEWNSLVTGDYNYLEILELDNSVLTPFSRSQIKNIGYIENGRIRVTPKPVQEILNQEIPSETFDATYPNLENEKKLLTLGACDLVAPKILDATTNTYFIADNIYNVVAVYDRGISVIFTQTLDGFVLSANPNGKILCNVQGLSDGAGSYEKHISDHIPRLLNRSGVDYNTADLTTIHPTIDSAWAGTNESALTAILVLLKSFNAYHYFESNGTLRFGKLQNPTTPTDTLDEIEIIGEVKAFKDTASLLSEKLLNDPNFNRYSESEIVYSAIESEKINFVKKYKVTTIGLGLHEFYKNNNPEMPTYSLGGQATGQVILDERIALWSQLRFFYTLSTTRVFNMNQVITLTNSLKGLEWGKNVLVIGKELNRETNKINYWMWG